MSRREYMRQLEALLSDIPLNERKEALQFYEDYFEDAGPENEQSAMEALGSPEQVAESIRLELQRDEACSAAKGNALTQDREISDRCESDMKKTNEQKTMQNGLRKRSAGEIILWVILCIFALPVAIPVAIAFLAAIFSVFVGVIALLAAFLIAGAAVLIVGLILSAVAVIKLFTVPIAAVYLLGGGMICTGVGILIAAPFIWLIYKLVPMFLRGIVKLCKLPFQKREKGEYGV